MLLRGGKLALPDALTQLFTLTSTGGQALIVLLSQEKYWFYTHWGQVWCDPKNNFLLKNMEYKEEEKDDAVKKSRRIMFLLFRFCMSSSALHN